MRPALSRRASVAGLVAALLALPAAASAAPASVAITSVDGQAVVDGRVAEDVKGQTLTVAGTSSHGAEDAPALVADAGDSSFVETGSPATLIASAGGGTSPYTYAWSYEGSASRFAKPDAFRTDFDTTGLLGAQTVRLTVTDSAGATATDTVRLFSYATSTTTLLSTTQSAGAGLVGLNEGDIRHPFDVPSDLETTRLALTLDWGTSYRLPTTSAPDEDFGGFNLEVEDPSGAEVSEGQGAEFTKPEDVVLTKAPAGTWNAVVVRTLTAPDTYSLEVKATQRPLDPVPTIDAGGPYSFLPGQPQVLRATTAGGTGTLTTAWDLDYDGVFETPDSAHGVTASLPLGKSLVTAKTTDAAGYERRETVAVVVGTRATDGAPGVVVVAVSDSGLNPYHEDFRATTFGDDRIRALTADFTKHPSEYIPGYPASAPAKAITFGRPFAAGKFHPAEDAGLWTRAATPLNTLFWIPGTKIVAAVDAGDSQPVNGEPDAVPFLDEDGHGTASASVAVGNLYGYCPTCLLAFGENFNADSFWYRYSWVDLASNSFGSLGNIGFAGLIDAAQPKANAERGQIALYAAGNGNENGFVTPQQTYTAENLGADWLVRVGAADKRDRKPIVGTGKPVDITSWGYGGGTNRLTAASNTTPGGTTDHSGTSAATPYSAGVFGTVLGQVRALLGDATPGQDNVVPGDGVIARGTPIAGSPYLKDGLLTRAELVEAVFKTARHDTGPDSITYPVTSPSQNPAQYVVEGYGIVEPASGERALDVLLGRAPLPVRPAEDQFFAADSSLRDELWGTWSGGGANGGAPRAAAETGPNPFLGVTAAALPTFDAAYRLLSERAGPFASDVTADAAAAAAAGGVTYYPHHQGGCTNGATPGAFLDTEDTPGDDDGCGAVGTSGLVGAEVESWTTPAGKPVAVTIPKGTAVDGTIYLKTAHPTDSLVTVTLSAGGRVVGSVTTEIIAISAPFGLGPWVPVPVELTTEQAVAPGEALTVSVAMDASAGWFFGYEGDHTSSLTFATGGGEDTAPGGLAAAITSPAEGDVVDPAQTPTLPVTGTAVFPADDAPRSVQVSVDDPTFAAPVAATLGTDGTWGAPVDALALADGGHTVYARAVSGSTSSPASAVAFTVRRTSTEPDGPTGVQVQVVPAGTAPQDGRWIATTGTGTSSWSGTVDLSSLPKGEYEVHARLLVDGVPQAADGPVGFTKKSPPRGGKHATGA